MVFVDFANFMALYDCGLGTQVYPYGRHEDMRIQYRILCEKDDVYEGILSSYVVSSRILE